MSTTVAAGKSETNRWLFGPWPDLLFGCGLLYLCFFALLAWHGQIVAELFPLALTPLIGLFLSIPHYGSTLLRVYEKPADRQKYRFFSVYLSLGVALWFVTSVYSSLAGSLLVTLYMIWSPWHYMGQNYGIALMFLGRRGISISPLTKRTIHLSFLCSYFLTLTEFLSFPSSEGFYRVFTLELSDGTRDVMLALFGSLYILSTLKAVIELKKKGSLSDLLPTLFLFFSQALWFLAPLTALRLNLFQDSVALSARHAVYAFFWVAIAHAIQYLWITSYYARKADNGTPVSGFLGKALLAGALIWVVPVVIFSPDLLGNRSYDGGLSILVAAAVNIHHFMLDGAIWKLREGRIARILLRNSNHESPPGHRSHNYLRAAVLGIGLLCVGIHYLGTVNTLRARQGLVEADLHKTVQAVDMLRQLQRDNAALQHHTARLAAREGDFETARKMATRAVALNPDTSNQHLLAQIERRQPDLYGTEQAHADAQANPLTPYSPRLQR